MATLEGSDAQPDTALEYRDQLPDLTWLWMVLPRVFIKEVERKRRIALGNARASPSASNPDSAGQLGPR